MIFGNFHNGRLSLSFTGKEDIEKLREHYISTIWDYTDIYKEVIPTNEYKKKIRLVIDFEGCFPVEIIPKGGDLFAAPDKFMATFSYDRQTQHVTEYGE